MPLNPRPALRLISTYHSSTGQLITALIKSERTRSSEGELEQDDGSRWKKTIDKRRFVSGAPARSGTGTIERGGSGGLSMHTLAVLSHTNCFSLRQISCKSRLRRQHCPGPPGRRDGRQADGAGGGGGGGGGAASGACTRGASEQDGGGRREEEGFPGESREVKKEREKKAPTLQSAPRSAYPWSGLRAPQPLTPPTLWSPPCSSQISALPSACPSSLSPTPSPSLHRKVEERWNSTKREKNQ